MIQSIPKLRGQKVIAVTTSIIAAPLLEVGIIAHSVLNVYSIFSGSFYNVAMYSKQTPYIRQANLIIWDEIMMCVRNFFEIVDRALLATMKSPNVPFGGKCILLAVISNKLCLFCPENGEK